MERNYEFSIGQKVWQIDPDDNKRHYGVVTDKTSITVFILWDDMHEPVEHEQWEYNTIHISKNN
jgi:hypothetical protein